tara:strand:- start:2401 stop:3354 length:954 start_codon:yes stop_codon:yes gene_type:complete
MEQSLATTQIFNANCLEKMKDLDDDSVDLIFCDLPYNQTSCKWDVAIDLELFWKEVMRIKKLNTPIFFTTTTKFGVSLIQSAPKKCFFRYDLVWVKSASAGFLSAKKMPMRKHEMIYVFYEKLPFYDLSSHTHKFIDKSDSVKVEKSTYGDLDIKQPLTSGARWNPPLPVSVVKQEGGEYQHIYGNIKDMDYQHLKGKHGNPVYDPPLPVSVVKQDKHTLYGEIKEKGIPHTTTYNPPLPNTLLEIKSTRGKHSTEKPVALMEWIFKYYSKEGDVVLDPTMGSGSTGVACKNMNRNFIGIEMDEEIFKVAESRLNII